MVRDGQSRRVVIAYDAGVTGVGHKASRVCRLVHEMGMIGCATPGRRFPQVACRLALKP